MMLAAVLAALVGCGKSDSPSQKEEPKAPPAGPNKAEPPPPSPGDKKDEPKKAEPGPLPASPLAGWQMDPAKHTIPTAPVTGSLAGAPFTPEVQVEGEVLRFRTLKNGLPDRQVELRLSDPGKTLEGTKLTVRPDQPVGPDVPHVSVTKPGATEKDPPVFATFDRGYALMLEVGKRDKGKVPGKVYLSLPGDAKDYLFGSFAADRVRSPDEPPGPDDAPFVQGKVTVTGAAEPYVSVGYVRVEPYEPTAPPVLDLIGTPLKPGGFPVRSESYRPRVGLLVPGAKEKDPARYEFTNLDPGRYWVFATLQGGPAAWKWLTVPADGKLTADFTIDPKAFGGLDVAVPGGVQRVAVVPAVEGGKPWTAGQAQNAGSITGLQAEPKPDAAKKDEKVTFPRLAPGKYEVFGDDLTATVEVKAGQTAKVELKKK
jgi:hypothetical protein